MMYHPIYGEMKVPDTKEEIKGDLAIAENILAEEYNPVVLGYKDILDSALDLCRREEDAI